MEVKVGEKYKMLNDCDFKVFKAGDIFTVGNIQHNGWYSIEEHKDGGACFINNNVDKYELVPETKPETGLRYNSGKLRWRNFPMFLMEPLVEVAQFGESKYDTFNFMKGLSTLDSLDSLKRHLAKFENPYEPDEDEESQVNHLAHVAWNALVALHFIKTRPDLDDRYKIPEEE